MKRIKENQSNQTSKLPNSNTLDTLSLANIFENTTNSYKYIYFISLLEILKNNKFEVNTFISFEEIIIGMLVNAWYPSIYSNLSFGTQDKVTTKLEELNIKVANINKKELYQSISNEISKDIIIYFKRYVPYRILCSFVEEELKAEKINRGKGNDLERKMPWIVEKYWRSRNPLYRFNSITQSECDSIIFNLEWAEYIEDNYVTIRSWAYWEWLVYMQRKNPKVDDMSNKLFLPEERDFLCRDAEI